MIRAAWPVLLLLFLSCSDSSTPADARAADRSPAADTAPRPGDRLVAPDHAAADTHAADRTIAVTPDYGLVKDCGAIGSKDCFGNADCAAELRCKNVGDVACCVPGARGSLPAGQTCTSEDQCASAVCIAKDGPSLCSKDCLSTADCPTGMKDCRYIAMSGSSLKWCFPEK